MSIRLLSSVTAELAGQLCGRPRPAAPATAARINISLPPVESPAGGNSMTDELGHKHELMEQTYFSYEPDDACSNKLWKIQSLRAAFGRSALHICL